MLTDIELTFPDNSAKRKLYRVRHFLARREDKIRRRCDKGAESRLLCRERLPERFRSREEDFRAILGQSREQGGFIDEYQTQAR